MEAFDVRAINVSPWICEWERKQHGDYGIIVGEDGPYITVWYGHRSITLINAKGE